MVKNSKKILSIFLVAFILFQSIFYGVSFAYPSESNNNLVNATQAINVKNLKDLPYDKAKLNVADTNAAADFQNVGVRVLDIVKQGSPILRKKSVEVNAFDQTLSTLVDSMSKTMNESAGVGIAAPQVGKNCKFFWSNTKEK